MPRIPINGLKLNGPLVSLWVNAADQSDAVFEALYRLLTDTSVNIVYMTAGSGIDARPALCCIDRKDADHVAALLKDNSVLADGVRLGDDVGLLTFYPHRSSFIALGAALELLGEHEIRIISMASSISALSFVVSMAQLETAGKIISQELELPPGATPPWAAVKTRQQHRQQ